MTKLTAEEGSKILNKLLAENKAKAMLTKAERKRKHQQELLEAIQKQNPNATLDEDGNIVFGKSGTQVVQVDFKLSDLIDKFMSEKDRVSGWSAKSRSETLSKLELFKRIVGDLAIKDMTHVEIREYRETIQKLPANLNKIKRYRDKPITQIIEMKNVEPMEIRTMGKNLEKARTLLKWGFDQRILPEDWTPLLRMNLPSKAGKKRDPFTTTDLEALFFSPEMLGSSNRPLKKPYQFWVPLLSLMTGARIEEICQLHVDDVQKVGKLWCISINDDGEKKLKNDASRRVIPISSTLIDIGFLKYVEGCRKKELPRLFSELNRGRDGYSPAASKWFAGYKNRCGIDSSRKVFHSFRHTLISHLQDKGFAEPMIAAFNGHKHGKVTFGVYGSGYKPETLKEMADAVDFGLDNNQLKQIALRFQP